MFVEAYLASTGVCFVVDYIFAKRCASYLKKKGYIFKYDNTIKEKFNNYKSIIIPAFIPAYNVINSICIIGMKDFFFRSVEKKLVNENKIEKPQTYIRYSDEEIIEDLEDDFETEEEIDTYTNDNIIDFNDALNNKKVLTLKKKLK